MRRPPRGSSFSPTGGSVRGGEKSSMDLSILVVVCCSETPSLRYRRDSVYGTSQMMCPIMLTDRHRPHSHQHFRAHIEGRSAASQQRGPEPNPSGATALSARSLVTGPRRQRREPPVAREARYGSRELAVAEVEGSRQGEND